MFEDLKEKLILYIYNLSNQPIKLHKLLEANLLFNEGMKLDGTKLGFRLRVGRAYIVYLILAHIVIIPTMFLAHSLFKILDCHASILVAIFFTIILFGLFNFFKEWTREYITRLRIKQMWELHFPHFPFDEYSQKVAKIYERAVEEDIKQSELERYILDSLSTI